MYIQKTLEKFYENKDFKYFPGNTIIHILDNREQIKLISKIREEMEENPLFNKFIFLPATSYHMTVCDILTYNTTEEENPTIKDICVVDQRIASVLENTSYDLNIKMIPKKIKAKKIVLEPKTAEDAKKLADFRAFVAMKTGIQLPKSYTFHISLAYQLMELTEQESLKMDQFLNYLDQKYLHLIKEIDVKKADFVLFNDMYAYGLFEKGRSQLGITKCQAI